MDWTSCGGRGRDYYWSEPFVGDHGFRQDMYPEGSCIDAIRTSDYQGPFGVMSFAGGIGSGIFEYQNIPFRLEYAGHPVGLRGE